MESLHLGVPVKLGKKAKRVDPLDRTLKFARYKKALPPAPPECDQTAGRTDFGMMLNDTLGDCTCAALGHTNQIFTGKVPPLINPTDGQVLQAYEQACGYVDGDPSTDQGGDELTVLKWAQTVGLGGNKIDWFAEIDLDENGSPVVEDVKQAIVLGGVVYIGVGLPLSAQNQTVWDVDESGANGSAEAGSWGGHAIILVAYNTTGPVCITWGALKQMTWAWFAAYCDEAYALTSKLWSPVNGLAPCGFDEAALLADLQAVTA